MLTTTPQGWEERFDKEFSLGDSRAKEYVKSFIRKELELRDKRITKRIGFKNGKYRKAKASDYK